MSNNSDNKKDRLKDYQLELKNKLQNIFYHEEVQTEWTSMCDERDKAIYSPRIDIAIGPFANEDFFGEEFDKIFERRITKSFIEILAEFSRSNLRRYEDDFVSVVGIEEINNINYNARCFMAIEIENKVSRKHLMGGAINASALGRIGVVIPWSEEKLRAFVKLFRYFQYLKYANKNTFNTSNLLIVTKEQMMIAIEETLDFLKIVKV